MNSNPRPGLRRLILGGALSATLPVHALIFITSGDPAFNSSAPGGALENSGWQYEGTWGGLLGTPVAPDFFLTAKHGGGSVGDGFSYQGTGFSTVARFDYPTADLTLWQVSGTFPTYAPLYSGADEAGKGLVVFGRSATRGDEVVVSGASVSDLRGWLWNGSGGGTQRWGENVVDATTVYAGADYLVAGFSRTGGVNEATLAGGDSGGGVFIQEGGTWKLAGINYAVEAEFRTSAGGPTFLAAIFDEGGLYADLGSGFVELTDRPADREASFYATRVSSYAGWIQGVAAVPEPNPMPILSGLALLALAAERRLRRAR